MECSYRYGPWVVTLDVSTHLIINDWDSTSEPTNLELTSLTRSVISVPPRPPPLLLLGGGGGAAMAPCSASWTVSTYAQSREAKN